MITLENALRAAQTDLRVMSCKGIEVTSPLRFIGFAVEDFSRGVDSYVLLAKKACEAIIDCAREAEDAVIAERLRGINRMLSPIVAHYIGIKRQSDYN